MTTFIELVITPAVLPLLIALIIGYVETRLDRDAKDSAHRTAEHPVFGGHST